MAGAQHVLKYLAKTASLRIEYSGEKGGSNITGYANADYAADESRSELQRSISTSTTEAEYLALAYAGKEAV
ncbi:MAG: hypothetical protein FE78DRAFT_31128 [Acidomyces sp. 'richmondensis']|nr:MAG: hypothetical protein FE78DRAFT_31128 [Acidomyces sp. 'richmondensis']